MKTAISLVSFSSIEGIKKFIEECHSFGLVSHPVFELSYIHDASFLEKLSFLTGKIISAHVSTPAKEYFPNLASFDSSILDSSLRMIRESAMTCAKFGGNLIVLHAGYSSDLTLPVSSKKRLEGLKELKIPPGYESPYQEGINTSEFLDSDFYRRFLLNAVKNLKEASRQSLNEGCVLAVENLNPRLSYLFQTPQEFTMLSEAIPEIGICIDVGHLWLSSLAHDFDYIEGLKTILKTGKVVSVHLHNNNSRLKSDGFKLADEHLSTGDGNIPMRQVIQILKDYSNLNIVMELTKANPWDYVQTVKLFGSDNK